MKSVLITSGLIQISFAVMQGWVISAMYSGMKRFGPLKNAKRVLQCHIDNILMSLLQFAIAAVHPAIPTMAGWLLVIGSWVNAQLFLVHATSAEGYVKSRAVSVVTLLSFSTLTIAYPWLLIAWLRS
ncbi:MAG: hypothetical protein P4L72_16395 [Parvibaculum sp.]|jgi:hypothetical protein|uniref:hypothetical protein n=1 Tax=Parvibaculum sp. TaxID=2024848 RepID=UPI002847929F|nr:hypothetical protein [Parvibaculum sp.]MDR3500796.1 hypothetical protein [Parvibaculum sp.]